MFTIWKTQFDLRIKSRSSRSSPLRFTRFLRPPVDAVRKKRVRKHSYCLWKGYLSKPPVSSSVSQNMPEPIKVLLYLLQILLARLYRKLSVHLGGFSAHRRSNVPLQSPTRDDILPWPQVNLTAEHWSGYFIFRKMFINYCIWGDYIYTYVYINSLNILRPIATKSKSILINIFAQLCKW